MYALSQLAYIMYVLSQFTLGSFLLHCECHILPICSINLKILINITIKINIENDNAIDEALYFLFAACF